MTQIYHIHSSILWTCPYGEITSGRCLWSRIKTDNIHEVLNCSNLMNAKIRAYEPRGHSPQLVIAIIKSENENTSTLQQICLLPYFKVTINDLKFDEEDKVFDNRMIYSDECYRDDLKSEENEKFD